MAARKTRHSLLVRQQNMALSSSVHIRIAASMPIIGYEIAVQYYDPIIQPVKSPGTLQSSWKNRGGWQLA
jgi:hypothetical protein